MNKIINKYLIINYFKIFLNTVLVFFALGLIMNLFEEIEFFKELDVSIFLPILLSFSSVPALMLELLPFITFLSAVFFLINFKSSKDLLVVKIFGYSNFKIISIVKLEGISKGKNDDIGVKIAMHIAASNPLAIDADNIEKSLVDKELEIIKAEITNSGKPAEVADKISKGKITKFLNDNSLLNQIWIMDPKKTVSDVLKENSSEKQIKILNFTRYKVGEGV